MLYSQNRKRCHKVLGFIGFLFIFSSNLKFNILVIYVKEAAWPSGLAYRCASYHFMFTIILTVNIQLDTKPVLIHSRFFLPADPGKMTPVYLSWTKNNC